ncbi:hypothetical protein BaRGS_00037740 [Batillaria attramentaria]|uniref:CUB domain-containing protein n=1 Tax=Batillaria attramentaria TaxID=370345 RepID=A0ABD0J7S4_9CAEN
MPHVVRQCAPYAGGDKPMRDLNLTCSWRVARGACGEVVEFRDALPSGTARLEVREGGRGERHARYHQQGGPRVAGTDDYSRASHHTTLAARATG